MSSRILAAALGLALVPAMAAQAANVSLSNITGAWSNAIPGATYGGNNTANPTARWGTPFTSAGQSGYNFGAAAGPIIATVPPSPSPNFVLGTFTHVNQPITGDSITSIRLSITANVAVDGTNLGSRSFQFDFAHDETSNGTNPCPYGGANGQGVNINGCADRVQVSYNSLSESFSIGGDVYTLNILGFTVGGVFTNSFLTTEAANNNAQLVANVALRSTVVPEPASLALLGTALVGLGLARRRRA